MAKSKYKKVLPPSLDFNAPKAGVRYKFVSTGEVWEEFIKPANENPSGERWFRCIHSELHTPERPSTLLGKNCSWTNDQIERNLSFNAMVRV